MARRIPGSSEVVRASSESAENSSERHERKARLSEYRTHSRLGPRGLRFIFGSLEVDRDNEVAIEVARKWVAKVLHGEVVSGLFIYGPPGTGKTHLACACLNELIDSGYPGVFLRLVDIPRNDQEAVVELASPSATPVLVLDDMGTAKPTERLVECVYHIIDGRLWCEAPLILTSNLNLEGIRSAYNAIAGSGDRLASRIVELCRPIPLGGKDRRKHPSWTTE